MTTEQKIAVLIESGQYELALPLAESQGIDIVNLPVDFNNMLNESDNLTSAAWTIMKFQNGHKICIAAGTALKSFKPKGDDKYLTFEVIVTGEDIDAKFANDFPYNHFMFSFHEFSDESGFQLVYGNMTRLKILELIKHVYNFSHIKTH